VANSAPINNLTRWAMHNWQTRTSSKRSWPAFVEKTNRPCRSLPRTLCAHFSSSTPRARIIRSEFVYEVQSGPCTIIHFEPLPPSLFRSHSSTWRSVPLFCSDDLPSVCLRCMYSRIVAHTDLMHNEKGCSAHAQTPEWWCARRGSSIK